MTQDNLQSLIDRLNGMEKRLIDRMDIMCKNLNYRIDELKQTDHKYEERIRALELDNAGAKANRSMITSVTSLIVAVLSAIASIFFKGGN